MQKQAKWGIGGKAKGKKEKFWYVPLPRQVDAIEAVVSGRYKWILYGGARGGAKSHFLRWLAYMLCLKYPGFQVLLLRRVYPQLEKTHMRRAVAEAPLFGATPVMSAKPPIVKFANGSVLEFGHCQDMKDVENYLSAEYNLVLPDEMGTFEEDQILRIASSARIKNADFRPCIVGTTNPGAVWVRDRWIWKEVDKDRYPDYNPDDYFFIQSLLDDNPYPDPEYEAFLNAQDPATKAAWRYGSWDAFEGQYFKEFSKDKHVQRLEIPSDVQRIGGLDWGYASPGVMLWGVVLPDGRLYIERELKFRETVAECVADQICNTNRDYGMTVMATYADPSMWIRSGQSGESIAETFSRSGVSLQRANHERTNGWQRLRHWLRPSSEGVPSILFSPDCPYLIRSLPSLIHDDTHPEDLDTHGDDHAADALRYLVMSRPAPFARSTPAENSDSLGAMMRGVAGAGRSIIGADNVAGR